MAASARKSVSRWTGNCSLHRQLKTSALCRAANMMRVTGVTHHLTFAQPTPDCTHGVQISQTSRSLLHSSSAIRPLHEASTLRMEVRRPCPRTWQFVVRFEPARIPAAAGPRQMATPLCRARPRQRTSWLGRLPAARRVRSMLEPMRKQSSTMSLPTPGKLPPLVATAESRRRCTPQVPSYRTITFSSELVPLVRIDSGRDRLLVREIIPVMRSTHVVHTKHTACSAKLFAALGEGLPRLLPPLGQ